MFFAHSERFIQIHLPQFLLTSYPTKSLPHQPNHCPRPIKSVHNRTSGRFSQGEQPGALLGVGPSGRTSHHPCHSGMMEREAVLLQLSSCWWCLPIVRNQSRRSLGFLFLCQSIAEAIGASWEEEGNVAGVGPWTFGPNLHVTYLCLQDLPSPDRVHATVTRR